MSSTDVICAAGEVVWRPWVHPTTGDPRACNARQWIVGEELREPIPIERSRVEPCQGLAVALLPCVDQAVEEAHPLGDAPLEQGDAQVGEAAGHATEEQGFGQRPPSGGEVPDLVVDEVGCRGAVAEPDPGGVRRQRQLQLDRLGPHRVVVVDAVDAEGVHPPAHVPLGDPERHPGIVGRPRVSSHRAMHMARDQPDLGAQLLGVHQCGNRLLGCVHRDQGRHGEPVAVRVGTARS